MLVLPTSLATRAASLKSKSYVGQAVLVLEGKPWGDLEAMFPLRKAPASRVSGVFRANRVSNPQRAKSPGAILLDQFRSKSGYLIASGHELQWIFPRRAWQPPDPGHWADRPWNVPSRGRAYPRTGLNGYVCMTIVR